MLGDLIESLSDFMATLLYLLGQVYEILIDTADRIDSIEFESYSFHSYLGYAKYAMGTPLFSLMVSIILISVGITLYQLLLKGLYFIQESMIRIGK